MARLLLLALCAACAVTAVVAIPTDYCDPGFECKWEFTDVGHLRWTFDFSPLCSETTDLIINDNQNHTYYVNPCGIAHQKCNPTWVNQYQRGAAVQMFGETPPCNLSTSAHCVDPLTGAKECCTRDCQVLGVGEPLWAPLDPINPFDGGVTVTHFGVPPSLSDPFECPKNTKTNQQADRRVTYHIMCDPSVPDNTAVPVTAYENTTSPCSYIIVLKSPNACGCAPQCKDRNCGSDGCNGNCGSKDGGCPLGWQCDEHKVCCKPDCRYRECGSDGCGGTCGTLGGGCPTDKPICMNTQICGAIPGAATVIRTSGGAIAGAFFGGIFGAVALGAVGLFFYKRQRGSYSWGGGGGGAGSGSGSSAAIIGGSSAAAGSSSVAYTGSAGGGGGGSSAYSSSYNSSDL